ncbi:IPT/TIG domain protein [compost metagenome]
MSRICNDIIGRPAHAFLPALFAVNQRRMSDRGASVTSLACRLGQWFAALCLVMLAFGVTPALAAGPSLICPTPQSFTVASGASYVIDLSSCNTFGLNDNGATALHGTITGLTNNQDNKATYTNNGDGALSDTFVLLDESQGEITFNVTVLPAANAFTVSPGSLTAPVIGTPYSQAMSASGGAAPYNYALDSGTLPLGITVSSSGVISGTVKATGSFAFGIKVTDATAGTPQVVIKNYSVTVAIPILSITPTVLTAGGLATPYSEQMSTANGTEPYTYVVESGALPAGLNLSSSGLLSGTPTALGTYNFVIKSTDVTGGNGPYNTSRSYSMVINAQPPPTITGVTPASGPASGGTAVTITGTGFTGVTALKFGANNGVAVTVVNATTMTATSPAGSAGTVNVTVTAAGGTSATDAANQFTYIPAPTVTSISPTAGPTAGGTSVTITGTGFTGATAVTFGATAATGFTVNSATQITATAPSGSGTVDVRVTTTGGTSATGAADQYTYAAAPTVTSISPTVGPATGGSTVTITGTGFGGTTAVTFGATAATGFTVNSAMQITATAPAGTGTVDVRVTTAGGTSATSAADQYTYVAAPAVTSISPATGPATGGTTVIITGSNFSGTTAVTFGATAATGFTVNSATQITATAPAGSAGTVNVRVTTVGGTSATGAADQFTYFGAPVAGAVSATVAYGSSANAITLNLSGGAATSVAIATGASHGTASASGNSITYTPTPGYGGADSFTYTATNIVGTSAPATVTITVGAPTLTIAPGTVPAATVGVAYSQTVTAANGAAPYIYAISAGALPAGLSLSSSGLLSGTTHVTGSFPFSITVTDSSTGVGAPFSATNSYTLAVAAPVLTLTPASLAAIRVGDAYSQTFTAAGGVAPYAYSVSGGALPTGLALDAATGTVSGTPTVAGSYAFTLQAKDANQFTVQQALTLLVTQAPPPVPNETATTSANQEVSLTIASTDGSPITAVTIVTPPQHGTVTVVSSGAAGGGNLAFKVTYVPNANYFGPDAFSYTATGPGGTSAPATVSVTVAPQPVPVPVAKTATVLAGTPVTLNVTEGATGGPFTSVAITTQPASGTAVVNGMDIVYTPGINTSGDISIGYTVSNAFGTSAPVKSTISVNPMPQVLSQSATVVAGLTVTVDLTAGATGGPFTAANILSVAPAEAGKVVVRDVGTAGKPSYQLSFAASGKFAGAAVVSYTLSNAYATSKPGVVNVTVTARRDPSVDPEVIGLQAAQADAARRFASAQLSNFTQRLESLHGDGWGRSSFGLSLTPPNDSGNPTAALARWQADEADRVFGTAVKPFMRKAALRQMDTGFSSERQQADVSGATSGLPDMPQKPDTQKQALSLWLGGAVDFGQHYVNGRETGFRFRTNGVSVGGDYRLSDLATVGVGAGFSHDRSDVGQNGSRSTADSAVAAVYGSLRPSKGVFLDGVLGYGTLQYDASRYLSDGSGFATGERDGKQVFGALVGGIEMRQETWMWSPYGRVELMSAKLDPYTEKAAGINALSYFKQTVRSRIGALGVRAEGIYVGGLGTWFPRARLEYRHQFQGADDARLAYADLAADGPVYVIRTVPQQTGNWAAGLGVKLLLSNGMTITVDYNSNLNMESGRTQSVMFGIAMPLK